MEENKKGLFIEPVKEEDLDTILEIERKSFSCPWTKGMFEREIMLPISKFIVLHLGNEIIGYGGYWKILEEAHIVNFAIAPEKRRKGYGEYLLKEMLNIAHSQGLKRAILEVRVSNLPAQELYRKCGFVNHSVRAKYYPDNNEDALLMVEEKIP